LEKTKQHLSRGDMPIFRGFKVPRLQTLETLKNSVSRRDMFRDTTALLNNLCITSTLNINAVILKNIILPKPQFYPYWKPHIR